MYVAMSTNISRPCDCYALPFKLLCKHPSKLWLLVGTQQISPISIDIAVGYKYKTKDM